MGVPTEKDISTISVRLVIPQGLDYVTPNVKQGWTIEVKKNGTGKTAKITEIIWTGGSIPTGQRDEFSFSAKVISKPATLQWKAYQTYADNSVVSWDKPENTPYSETQVIDDLAKAENTQENDMNTQLTYFSTGTFGCSTCIFSSGFT